MSDPKKASRLCIKLCCYPLQYICHYIRGQQEVSNDDLLGSPLPAVEESSFTQPVSSAVDSDHQTSVHTQQPHSHLCQDSQGRWNCLLHLEYFQKTGRKVSFDPLDCSSGTSTDLGRQKVEGRMKTTTTPWPSEENSIAILTKPRKRAPKLKGIIKLPKASDWSVLTDGKISTFPDQFDLDNDLKKLSSEEFFSQLEEITARNTERNKYIALENLPSNIAPNEDEVNAHVRTSRVAILLDRSVDESDADDQEEVYDEEDSDEGTEEDEPVDNRSEATKKLASHNDDAVIIADFHMPILNAWVSDATRNDLKL